MIVYKKYLISLEINQFFLAGRKHVEITRINGAKIVTLRAFLAHVFSSGLKIYEGCTNITKARRYKRTNQKKVHFLFNKRTRF